MGVAIQDILEREEILLKHNDMNNEEKAQEICEKNKQFHVECSSLECYLSALEMAKWKDEQLSKCLENLEKEYIRNSGKGLYDNNVIAAKLATLKRIEEEMK